MVVLTEQLNKLVKISENVVNFNFAQDFNFSGKLFYCHFDCLSSLLPLPSFHPSVVPFHS